MMIANDNGTAVNGAVIPTMSVEDTMKVTAKGREVTLAYAKWDARGMLATITIDEGGVFRPITIRIDRNGTTEREAMGLVRGVAKMLAGGLVLDGNDLQVLGAERDGVTLLSSETNGTDTVDTFRIRGAA